METNKVPSQRGNVHRFMIAVTTVLCIACVVYVWLFTTSVYSKAISIILIFVGPSLIDYILVRHSNR
jgi:hypothetical protein